MITHYLQSLKRVFLFSLLITIEVSFGQDTSYFNNVFNPLGTWAKGAGIVQVEDHYYGIFETEDPGSFLRKVGIFRMDLEGNIDSWNYFGEEGLEFEIGVDGGNLIKSNDGNLIFVCYADSADNYISKIFKLNTVLEPLWIRDLNTEYHTTVAERVLTTEEGNYIIGGFSSETQYGDTDILLMKTDSAGNLLWYHSLGDSRYNYLGNFIQTPDKGFLIGGSAHDAVVYDPLLDALAIKTDSLGNQQWINSYGHSWYDDDRGYVSMAQDGTFLLSTVYGLGGYSYYDERMGKLFLVNIDQAGNTLWSEKITTIQRVFHLHDVIQKDDELILAGSISYGGSTNKGFIYRYKQNGDSVWMREYKHPGYTIKYRAIAGISHTSDKGFVTIGTDLNLWVTKLDSFGCDVPGCNLGTWGTEFTSISNTFRVFPNPSSSCAVRMVYGRSLTQPGSQLKCFSFLGKEMYHEKLYSFQKESVLKVDAWPPGIYLAIVYKHGKPAARTKFVVSR